MKKQKSKSTPKPSFESAWSPAPERTIVDYAEKFISLCNNYVPSGPVNLKLSRYLIRPLLCLTFAWIRTVTFMKAVQSGGSLVGDLFLYWLFRVCPAAMMINMQTDKDAEDHATIRINETLELNPVTKFLFPGGKHKMLKTEKHAQMMWLLIQGANRSNLQSKPTCYVTNDELAFWKENGLLKDANARTTAWSWRSKIFNVSQAGIEDDEMDVSYKAGSMEEWSFRCPECDLLQPYKWQYEDHQAKGGIKYDKASHTDKDGNVDWEKLYETIHYECRGCSHKFYDDFITRRAMDDSGEYVVTNPKAPSDHVSFRVNAIAVPHIRWSLLVREWCEAIEEYRKGNVEPLKRFIQKRLCEPFGENFSYLEGTPKNNRDYKLGDKWDALAELFMGVDKQKDCYYFVIRGFASNGESRLIDCGRLFTEAEIFEKAEKMKVPDDHIFIDAATWSEEVYEYCCVFGWRAMIGDDKAAFVWLDANKQKSYRAYSQVFKIDPAMGYNRAQINDPKKREFLAKRKYQYAFMVRWSNPWVKDYLQRLKSGRGLYWGVATDAPQQYLDHLEGEKKLRVKDKWEWKKVGRKGDHMLDCERMILTGAMIFGLMGGASAVPESDDTPKEAEKAHAE